MSDHRLANPGLTDVPVWRREPFRLLFPLGVALLWAGVVHWVLFSLGWIIHYESVFHSIAQIQGFLTAFAAGFLLTMIPRRTATAAPGAVTMLVMLAAPVLSTVFAWMHWWALSQVSWGVLVAVLLAFALRRFGRATRRPPTSFVWIPIALATGVTGSGLIAAYGIAVAAAADAGTASAMDFRWHDVGRGMLLQGMFLGLVIGVGGLALPLMTRKESAADADPSRRGVLWLHGLFALVLVGSFVVENFVSPRVGYAARAGVVLVMLVWAARIHRPPSVPGLHRRYMWLAAWLLPIGYALAAVWPEYRQLGLHTVFIGGFAWLTLSIGMHVPLAHGGAGEGLDRASPSVVGLGVFVSLALVARAMVELDPARRVAWIGISAALLLIATLCWCVRVLPFAWARPSRASR